MNLTIRIENNGISVEQVLRVYDANADLLSRQTCKFGMLNIYQFISGYNHFYWGETIICITNRVAQSRLGEWCFAELLRGRLFLGKCMLT